MRKAQHRRPRKRADASPLQAFFASCPRWAILPVIAAAAGIVAGLSTVFHYSRQVELELVTATVVVMALAAAGGLREKTRARERLVSTRRLEDLRAMSPWDFEALVLSAYKSRGVDGHLTLRGADGGVDVVLQEKGEKVFVQCKRWRDNLVGPDPIRSLKGVMAGEGVTRGIFVSSGRFTPEAERVAAAYAIETVDGHDLLDLVREAREEVPGLIDTLRGGVPADRPAAPSCPRCHGLMVLRAGPTGNFWGCQRFPSCRGTVPL